MLRRSFVVGVGFRFHVRLSVQTKITTHTDAIRSTISKDA